jgi:hypothetical protein
MGFLGAGAQHDDEPGGKGTAIRAEFQVIGPGGASAFVYIRLHHVVARQRSAAVGTVGTGQQRGHRVCDASGGQPREAVVRAEVGVIGPVGAQRLFT